VLYSSLRAIISRVRELGRQRSLDEERDEEFRFHVEMQEEYNRRMGMSDVEARRAAHLAFGGVQRYREETHAARGFTMLEEVARDTRFAFRRLCRAPSFTLGVIATLGVGVGTAGAIARSYTACCCGLSLSPSQTGSRTLHSERRGSTADANMLIRARRISTSRNPRRRSSRSAAIM
jgi:hypothetical protein